MLTAAGCTNPDTGQQLLAIKSAADHAARAHKGQYRKDRRTPYIIHPARVAALVGMFGGTHVAIITAWLHDIYEDCTPEWIAQTEQFIAHLPFSDDEKNDINAMVDALTKKNTIRGKAARLSDSIDRILDAPPEATLIKLCDRIDNFLDSSPGADSSGNAILHQRTRSSNVSPHALNCMDTTMHLLLSGRFAHLRKKGIALFPVDKVDRVDQRLDR